MKTLNDQQRRAMVAFGGKAQSHMAASEMGELLGRVGQMHWDIESTGNIAAGMAQELAKETYDTLFTLPQLFAYIESYVPNFWQMVEDAGELEKCRMEERLLDAERGHGLNKKYVNNFLEKEPIYVLDGSAEFFEKKILEHKRNAKCMGLSDKKLIEMYKETNGTLKRRATLGEIHMYHAIRAELEYRGIDMSEEGGQIR